MVDVLVVVQNDRLQAVLPEGTPEELLTLASDDVLRQVILSAAILTMAIPTMAILTMAIL